MNHNQTHFNVSRHNRIGFIRRIVRAYRRFREEKKIPYERCKNAVEIDRDEARAQKDPLRDAKLRACGKGMR